MILDNGNTIVKTPQYMYVSVSLGNEKAIQIWSSHYMSGFLRFRGVRLPKDALVSSSFTLLDASENQVFLFIKNKGPASPFGNLYISDETGRSFTLTISNVIIGSAVDFEKVSSLDGTYIVNRYVNPQESGTSSYKAVMVHREFDESDMIAEESKKSRMQRGGTSDNLGKKQA